MKTIQGLSRQYKVRGVFKVGRPGYIYIDGTLQGVESSVKALKVRQQVPMERLIQKLNWYYLTVKLREQYAKTEPDKSRPTMTKVEDMDEMWNYIWNHGAEKFITLALFGEDALSKGYSPPPPPSEVKK